MTVMVFGYLILISIGFYDFIKTYQTVKTEFDHISKHVRQKYSTLLRIFNSSLCLEM